MLQPLTLMSVPKSRQVSVPGEFSRNHIKTNFNVKDLIDKYLESIYIPMKAYMIYVESSDRSINCAKKSQKVALLGDNIASMAKNNGWTGIIIDGYVRDIELLKKINIGVMALGSNPRKSKKENKGEINIDIRINNAIIKQGNWLYADLNGIIISPKKLIL